MLDGARSIAHAWRSIRGSESLSSQNSRGTRHLINQISTDHVGKRANPRRKFSEGLNFADLRVTAVLLLECRLVDPMFLSAILHPIVLKSIATHTRSGARLKSEAASLESARLAYIYAASMSTHCYRLLHRATGEDIGAVGLESFDKLRRRGQYVQINVMSLATARQICLRTRSRDRSGSFVILPAELVSTRCVLLPWHR